jgi:PAS domain S-box-containing protein
MKKTIRRVHDQTAALRKSELRYRRLFESAQDGILLLDAETGAITDVNPFLLDLLGYPCEEMIGRHLWEIGELKDVAANKAAFAILQEKEYVRYHNLPLRTRDGEICPVEFVSNVYDVEGESVIQCNIRRISLRSNEEEALREQRVQVESAEKAKADVLAVLSHELRTPLSAISSMLDILELSQETVDKLKSPPRASLFDNPGLASIRRNVRIGIRLLNELLDVTHLERGVLHLSLELVDAHQAVADVLADFGAQRVARRIGIRTELRASGYQINADPIKLHQILSNLVGNAIKFTPPGGLLDIATYNSSNGEFVIVIHDNGIGMEAAEMANVFAPFVQGDSSIHQRYGGLGLGLSICKRLMEAHGGSISAHSAGLNLGSSFTLQFPCANADVSRPRTPLPGAPASLSILLVEDDEDSRNCMSRLLQMRGHEVVDARNGSEAVQFGRNCNFDLLITDIGLPDLSGLMLLGKLRETQPDLEGLVLSGFAMPIDAVKSKEAGYLAHLSKPVGLPQLDEAIRHVVQNRQGQAKCELQ